jgi:hypothetical protein
MICGHSREGGNPIQSENGCPTEDLGHDVLKEKRFKYQCGLIGKMLDKVKDRDFLCYEYTWKSCIVRHAK